MSRTPARPPAPPARTRQAAQGKAAPGKAAPGKGAAVARPGAPLSEQAAAFASAAFQVWPGKMSAAARQALTGLSVSVHEQQTGLSVTAGVNGQAPAAPHLYVGGVKVYIVEASMGDDSGNSDYSLGDDGLVVTNAQGRILG